MASKSEPSPAKPGERIAKVIARAGLASRREAEAMIAAGRVAVNGAVIASPAVNVGAKDRITVDGTALPARERTRLFLYHKPRGLMTTHADPQGRPTLFAGLPRSLPRLVSVGRLDLNTEGLLLLTNDGGLARVLELPATGWLRRYRVRAHGRVTQGQLDRLRHGVTIDGLHYGPIEAVLDREQGANVWLTLGVREGKNREVRKIVEHLGLQVARLIRVSFGPFQLGEMPAGAVEEVKTRHLREQLGEKLASLAGCDFSAPAAQTIPPRERAGESHWAEPQAPPPPERGRSPSPAASRARRVGVSAGREIRPPPVARGSAGSDAAARKRGKDKKSPVAAKPGRRRRPYHGKRKR